jgi:hypothetical protein
MTQQDPWAGFGGQRPDAQSSSAESRRTESAPALSGACWVVGTAGPGSAGATTCAVALATLAGALLVEAGCDGGVLGLRYGGWVGRDAPSLASLLASLEDDSDPDAVIQHAQRLPSGVPAVLLNPTAEEAIGPVERLTLTLPALRRALSGRALVVDVGRLRPGAGLTMAGQADAVTIVIHPTAEGVGALLARLPVLLAQLPFLVVLVKEGTGRAGYPFTNVRDTILDTAWPTGGALVVLPLPDDPRGVAALTEPAPRRPWSTNRSGALAGAIRELLDTLARTAPAPARADVAAPRSGPQASETARRDAEGAAW